MAVMEQKVNFFTILPNHKLGQFTLKELTKHLGIFGYTGGSRLMRISLLRISLLRFFKTITKIWLMRFYGLFILLLRT